MEGSKRKSSEGGPDAPEKAPDSDPSERVASGAAAERGPSILESDEVKKFIERRGIRPEDFGGIESLAAFPREFIIMNFHNHFNMYRERSADELARLMRQTKNEDFRRACELWLDFIGHYDWAAAYNLTRILEEKEEAPGTYFRWMQRGTRSG